MRWSIHSWRTSQPASRSPISAFVNDRRPSSADSSPRSPSQIGTNGLRSARRVMFEHRSTKLDSGGHVPGASFLAARLEPEIGFEQVNYLVPLTIYIRYLCRCHAGACCYPGVHIDNRIHKIPCRSGDLPSRQDLD